MPSERSKPSEMTGEKAARSKVRSISLATCCSPFCTTTSVTGSIVSMAGALSLQRADGDLEVAQRVDARAIARLDHGGRVELLDDRRAREQGARSELLPAEGGGVLPGPVEPHAPPSGGRDRAARRAVDGEEAVQ